MKYETLTKHSFLNKCGDKEFKLEIQDGYSSPEEVLSKAKELGIFNQYISIVKFMEQYYLVCLENLEKQLVIGSEQAWYRNADYQMNCRDINEFKMPYKIGGIRTTAFRNLGVYYDLKELDPGLEIYRYKGKELINITDKKYSSIYAIILGVTFYDVFFDKVESKEFLKCYFDTDYKNYFSKRYEIVRLNPFRSVVEFECGTVGQYTLFKPQPKKNFNW